MTGDPNDDRLWTSRELAKFMGYSESTVTRMVSQEPDKLPPRVASMARPRWVPSICRKWAIENSGRSVARRQVGGRPRQID